VTTSKIVFYNNNIFINIFPLQPRANPASARATITCKLVCARRSHLCAASSAAAAPPSARPPPTRGLHSSTFQLNLSRFGHLLESLCLIDWGETMHETFPTKCAYIEPKSERV
jgi:hypothetical protein